MESCTVLLVDDETDFRTTLEKRLKRRGVDVTGVDNGAAALARLETGPVDVVILDVRMPGMNGIEVLAEIRRQYPLVQVIMLSAQVDVDVAIEGLQQGAYDYLMKPADLEELLYKIQDAAKRKSIQEAKMKALRRTSDLDG